MGVPYATAYRALVQRAQARGGDRVLVHGASGGVGTAAVQIAKALGMIVTGTAGTDEGLKLVKEQGADFVFNHKDENYLKQAFEVTDNCGFDVILEMLANVNLDNDLDVLAQGGRVVVIGNRGRIEIDPRKTMRKDSSILGMALMNSSEADLCANHAALVAGLANGTLHPVVEKAYPLLDAPVAHEAIMQPGAYGNIVLVPDWG
jgi:NADPH2:quinone reductase